jgi:hypothetical protein
MFVQANNAGVKTNWKIVDTTNEVDAFPELKGPLGSKRTAPTIRRAEPGRKPLTSPCPPTSRDLKLGGLPHLSFIQRKPRPLGTEFKSAADAVTGVMLWLEIQQGKAAMQKRLLSEIWVQMPRVPCASPWV